MADAQIQTRPSYWEVGTMTFTPTGSTTPITIEFLGAGHPIVHIVWGTTLDFVVNKRPEIMGSYNLFLVGRAPSPSTATSKPNINYFSIGINSRYYFTTALRILKVY